MGEDISVIKQCQQGDLEKFGVLYDKYIRKIYDFVYYKTHHQETAEDLTSRVFIKALQNIKKFKIGQGTFQAWLYQIARNTVIDHYRTQKVVAPIEDVWDLSDRVDVARDIEVKIKLEKVEQYLSRLKPEYRDIIIMRVWQEMSHQEIADVFGKSEASSKMMFGRAMKKLRAEMPHELLLLILLFRL